MEDETKLTRLMPHLSYILGGFTSFKVYRGTLNIIIYTKGGRNLCSSKTYNTCLPGVCFKYRLMFVVIIIALE